MLNVHRENEHLVKFVAYMAPTGHGLRRSVKYDGHAPSRQRVGTGNAKQIQNISLMTLRMSCPHKQTHKSHPLKYLGSSVYDVANGNESTGKPSNLVVP